MIDYRQLRSEGGDCTAPYEVYMDRPYTVGEFVKEIACRHNWGEICVGSEPFWFGGTSLGWYRDENLGAEYDGNVHGEFDHSYDDMVVVSARMSGGWSRYDYKLCIGK